MVLAAMLVVVVTACSSEPPAASPPPTATFEAETPVPTATSTAAPLTSTPVPSTATPRPASKLEPSGFPIDPETKLGVVSGNSPDRSISWGAGPAALEYSRDAQPSSDPVAANRSGWNCRVHGEYEAAPAVDWYVPAGTPVLATMDGVASLFVVTVSNPFDVFRVDREPYIGNPDRARAPLSPFPGSGGGKGIFVRVENAGFLTEYAHLDVSTFEMVPSGAFVNGYSAATDFALVFRTLRTFQTFDEVASWPVRAGDVIGLSGDTGYSEAPHLHYTVRRAGGPLLCPTMEPGFADGGWLFR
jgi:murein DD-endopeptidase MepM/ murein hydrolase activator NlpD